MFKRLIEYLLKNRRRILKSKDKQREIEKVENELCVRLDNEDKERFSHGNDNTGNSE